MARPRDPEDWTRDLSGARPVEQRVAATLRRHPQVRRFSDFTEETELDFEFERLPVPIGGRSYPSEGPAGPLGRHPDPSADAWRRSSKRATGPPSAILIESERELTLLLIMLIVLVLVRLRLSERQVPHWGTGLGGVLLIILLILPLTGSVVPSAATTGAAGVV